MQAVPVNCGFELNSESITLQGCRSPLVVKYADTQKEKDLRKIFNKQGQSKQNQFGNAFSSGLTQQQQQQQQLLASVILFHFLNAIIVQNHMYPENLKGTIRQYESNCLSIVLSCSCTNVLINFDGVILVIFVCCSILYPKHIYPAPIPLLLYNPRGRHHSTVDRLIVTRSAVFVTCRNVFLTQPAVTVESKGHTLHYNRLSTRDPRQSFFS